ncbi:MAG: hypothetical protein IKN73_03655 [Alphaproteobacteria bacterium]|nr:hypothetical protein [Alphaproteobacteria bacterium]
MKNIFAFSLVLISAFNAYGAEVLDLNTALQNTYKACVDIDDNLHELKVLAGVNTAVTAVGTGLGVGAAATGFAKADKDTKAKKLADKLNYNKQTVNVMPSDEEMNAFAEAFKSSADIEKEFDKLRKQSKTLGNWRTGLLAGNTATNVAGAIISSRTINKDNIKGQIESCVSATQALNAAITAAKLNGEYIDEAQNIYNACREYEFIDVSAINKRGTGAMISASIGAGLGGIGTITSGVANSESVRKDKLDVSEKTDADWDKEKNLNTAANVLSVGATAASATATIFNATQIAAIKKVAKVSESCTGALK